MVARYPVSAGGDVAIDWNAGDAGGSRSWQPRVQPAHWNGQSSLSSQVKYMFSRLRDKYEILEEQILDVGDALAKQLKIDEWAPNNKLQSVSQDCLHRHKRLCFVTFVC